MGSDATSAETTSEIGSPIGGSVPSIVLTGRRANPSKLATLSRFFSKRNREGARWSRGASRHRERGTKCTGSAESREEETSKTIIAFQQTAAEVMRSEAMSTDFSNETTLPQASTGRCC